MKEYNIHLDQDNVTLGTFISMCKSLCKYKEVPFTFDKETFINCPETDTHYYNSDNNEFISYVKITRPYTYIEYKHNKDGSRMFTGYSFDTDENNPKIGLGTFKMFYKNK